MPISNRNARPGVVEAALAIAHTNEFLRATAPRYFVLTTNLSQLLTTTNSERLVYLDEYFNGLVRSITPTQSPFSIVAIDPSVTTINYNTSSAPLIKINWTNGYHDATIKFYASGLGGQMSLAEAFRVRDDQRSTVTGQGLPAGADCHVNIGGRTHCWCRGVGPLSTEIKLYDPHGQEVAVMTTINLQGFRGNVSVKFRDEKASDENFVLHLVLALVVLNRF